MTTPIASRLELHISPQRNKHRMFGISAPGFVAATLFLGASPGHAKELPATWMMSSAVTSHAPVAFTEQPSPTMSDVWEITLYWYLEWINQILTDALEQLDALDSPEIWMGDVTESYLTYGVPDDLSLTERLLFLTTVDAVIILLDAPPATLSSAATASFRNLLVEMKAEI